MKNFMGNICILSVVLILHLINAQDEIVLEGTGCHCPGDPSLDINYSPAEVMTILRKINQLRRSNRTQFEIYSTTTSKMKLESLTPEIESEDSFKIYFPTMTDTEIQKWLGENTMNAESMDKLYAQAKSSYQTRQINKIFNQAYNELFPTPEPTTTTTTTAAPITTAADTTAAENPATTAAENAATTAAENAATTAAENAATTAENAATTAADNAATTAAENPATTAAENPATTAAENPETTAADNAATTAAENAATTAAENAAAATTAAEGLRRRKRETSRPSGIPMVISREKGMGIKAGADSGNLADAEVCWECQMAATRVRKVYTTSYMLDVLDLTSDAFSNFKIFVEHKFDKAFEDAMEGAALTINDKVFDSKVGYYGSEVVTVYEESSSGARKKRTTGPVVVEVDISIRDGTIDGAGIDQVLAAADLDQLNIASSESSAITHCKASSLTYPSDVLDLIDLTETDDVQAGTRAYLSCKDGHLLSETLANYVDLKGFGVLCGIGGVWDLPAEWPDTVTGCVPTPMCTNIPHDSELPETSGLERFYYAPRNEKGAVLEGDKVIYACKESNSVINDGSGLGIYEAVCKDSVIIPDVWPQCVTFTPCATLPTPDSDAAASGLKLASNPDVEIWDGEYAVYNCTKENKPVTVTGSKYMLKCTNGEITAPNKWPVCREPESCDLEAAPVAPASTHLLANISTPVQETETLKYQCTLTDGKTYLPDYENNEFPLTCLSGGKWQVLEDGEWPVCQDTTTTTEPPTTTPPFMNRDCYCLGDTAPSDDEEWQINIERHKEIAKVCRMAHVTFERPIIEVDQSNNRYIVPVKEQCGVKDPYIPEYGHRQGLNRSFTVDDTCSCTSTKVIGYWATMEIPTQEYSSLFDNPISTAIKSLRQHLEELFDGFYLEGREDVPGLFNKNFIRARVMRFAEGETILNKEDIEMDPEIEPIRSLRVMLEVQFAGENSITLEQFNTTHRDILAVNSTISEEKFKSGKTLVVNLECNPLDNPQALDSCPVTVPPRCLNRDFDGVPDYLTHKFIQYYDNGTEKAFPHMITNAEGIEEEFTLVVGETIDFVCKDPDDVKQFRTTDPELQDNVLTVLCKPDKYYNVPNNWPVCKAKCPSEKPIPTNETRLELWVDHPKMKDILDEELWEDDSLFYKCLDPKNEGVVMNPALGDIGDRRITSQEFKCTEKGIYNTPTLFRKCAPKPDVCECLGDLTEEQSINILDMVCRNDSLLEDNYHYDWHQEEEEKGLLLIPNKTRCGVEKADYPSLDEKCYCHEIDGQGVKTGFWHLMEVLSMPWHEDLFWPNTTMFKEAKILLEQELDDLYIASPLLFGKRYVRSIVFKFEEGRYLLKHQTSSTSTTSTTSTTTYVPPRRSKRKAPGSKDDSPIESPADNPRTEEVFFYDEYDGENDDEEVWLREKREALDEQRDYQVEGHDKAFREDGKWMIGARGMWPYGEGEKSTRAWVEHQFMEEFTVLEFDEVEFEEEHIRLLTERDGQWLDDTKNLTLWLSQSCYETRKCLISDLGRCENTILDILPLGFTHEKPKTMVPRSRENLDLKEEYMVPVGGEVNIKCSEHNQKISKDEWDNNPKDQLLTVKCLPNFKFDIPASNFPRCRGYCAAPGRLWNASTMENDVLPLQKIYTLDPSLPFREATHPDVGYRQLEPNDYTGLTLNRNKTNPEDEFWEGDKIYFICINSTLGVEEGDSNEVTFRCRYDGVYAVPGNNTWPECDIKTTTAKPPIVYGVQMSLEDTDEELDSFMKMKDYLFMQTQGDVEGLFWKVTLPSGLILLLLIIMCLLGTRHNSILCQVCNRDYELKQMQNYGHKEYVYEG